MAAKAKAAGTATTAGTAVVVGRQAIEQGIMLLAQRDPDRAGNRNDIGFNGSDSGPGHRLADHLGNWGDAEYRQALKILRKYEKTQLAPSGIALPSDDTLDADLKAQPAVKRATGSLTEVVTYGALKLCWRLAEYDQQAVVDVKAIGGGRYHPDTKAWTFDHAKVVDLVEKFPGFTVSEPVRRAYLAAKKAQPAQAQQTQAQAQAVIAPAPKMLGYIKMTAQGIAWKLNDYDANLVAKVKQVGGGRYNGQTREWTFPAEKAADLLAAFAGMAFEVDPGLAKAQKEAEAVAAKAAAEADRRKQAELERVAQLRKAWDKLGCGKEFDANGVDKKALPGGRHLLKHQAEGIEVMLDRLYQDAKRGYLIADQMGTGKTTTSLVMALLAKRAWKATIYCIVPAGLRLNWGRELDEVGVEAEIYSYGKVPERHPGKNPYVCLFDEAHYLQNIKSQRTQRSLALGEGAALNLPITGTPIKNGRPVNLEAILMLMGHPIIANKWAYEKTYCNAGPTRYSKWDTSGASNLDDLHLKLRGSMLLRTKDQVMKYLPPKIRTMIPIELDDAEWARFETRVANELAEHDIKVQIGKPIVAKYQPLIREWKDTVATRRLAKPLDLEAVKAAEATLEAVKQDFEAELKRAGGIQEGGEALSELGVYRKVSSEFKVADALELADEVIESGKAAGVKEQVVIFTLYKESVELIKRHYRQQGILVDAVSGELNTDERQRAVDRFQRGDVPVIIVTAAGGVGITLTAAQTVILIDRPWTPGDAEQFEDRLHRHGQTGGVKGHVAAYWIQLGEVDRKVDAILADKAKNIQRVMQGERKTLRASAGLTGDINAVALSALKADLRRQAQKVGA